MSYLHLPFSLQLLATREGPRVHQTLLYQPLRLETNI